MKSHIANGIADKSVESTKRSLAQIRKDLLKSKSGVVAAQAVRDTALRELRDANVALEYGLKKKEAMEKIISPRTVGVPS